VQSSGVWWLLFRVSKELHSRRHPNKPLLLDSNNPATPHPLFQSAFKEISRLRLAMPLLFQVSNDKLKSAATMPARPGAPPTPQPPQQCCGVLEFSAPEGQAYVPAWMLRNLKLRDGGTARFTTLRDVPSGTFVRFRPHRCAAPGHVC
jgi:hypothetical protein